jgi:NAD-dependent dihydropyrimidine dehydrogenase PreA subunit
VGIRRIDFRLCTGCGICVEHCPLDVLRMDDRTGKAFFQYIHDCQGCFLCEVECPSDAIYCMSIHEKGITRAW